MSPLCSDLKMVQSCKFPHKSIFLNESVPKPIHACSPQSMTPPMKQETTHSQAPLLDLPSLCLCFSMARLWSYRGRACNKVISTDLNSGHSVCVQHNTASVTSGGPIYAIWHIISWIIFIPSKHQQFFFSKLFVGRTFDATICHFLLLPKPYSVYSFICCKFSWFLQSFSVSLSFSLSLISLWSLLWPLAALLIDQSSVRAKL